MLKQKKKKEEPKKEEEEPEEEKPEKEKPKDKKKYGKLVSDMSKSMKKAKDKKKPTDEEEKPTFENYEPVEEPIYYKNPEKDTFEVIDKPLFVKDEEVEEPTQEDEELKPVEKELYVKDPKKGFKTVKKICYVKNKDAKKVYDKVGQKDDDTLKKFQKLAKGIFVKKPGEKGLEKIDAPMYIRTDDKPAEGKDGKNEEKEFEPISSVVYVPKEGVDPEDAKEDDFEKVEQPVFVKKFYADDVLDQLGEKDKDNELKNHEKVDEPLFIKKVDPTKEPGKDEPKEVYQRVTKPLYITKEDKKLPEDKDFKPVETPVYRIKEGEPEEPGKEDKTFEPVKRRC